MKRFLFLVLSGAISLFAEGETDSFLSEYSKNNLNLVRQNSPKLYEKCTSEVKIFQDQFQKLKGSIVQNREDSLIPKTVHFIWLGPKPFPEIKIVESWKKYNPDFTIVLWTDRERDLPLPYLKIRYIHELAPLKLEKEYGKATNWGERSDILRYEILERWGGIYADVDIECIKPIDYLVNSCTFFAGMAEISPMVTKHFVHIPNSIIAARENHPIITKTIDRIQERWDQETENIKKISLYDYNPEKTYSVLLTFARTYVPLTDAILATGLGERDFIFPSNYFDYAAVPNEDRFIRNYSFQSWFPEGSYNPITGQYAASGSQISKVKKKITKCYRYSFKFLGISVGSLLLSILLLTTALFTKRRYG